MRVSQKKNCDRCKALVSTKGPIQTNSIFKKGCAYGLPVKFKNREYIPKQPCPKPKFPHDTVLDGANLLDGARDERGVVREQPRRKQFKMQRDEALFIALECMKAADRDAFPVIDDALEIVGRMYTQILDRKEKERAYRESISPQSER